jgi:myosin heavy subunit
MSLECPSDDDQPFNAITLLHAQHQAELNRLSSQHEAQEKKLAEEYKQLASKKSSEFERKLQESKQQNETLRNSFSQLQEKAVAFFSQTSTQTAELKKSLAEAKVREDKLAADLQAAKEREEKLTADLQAAKEREEKLTADLQATKERENKLAADLQAAKERENLLLIMTALLNQQNEELLNGLVIARNSLLSAINLSTLLAAFPSLPQLPPPSSGSIFTPTSITSSLQSVVPFSLLSSAAPGSGQTPFPPIADSSSVASPRPTKRPRETSSPT